MNKKKVRQVCECKNCGNEAEMEITCQWVEEEEVKDPEPDAAGPKKVKGTGVCEHCGSEADLWVEI